MALSKFCAFIQGSVSTIRIKFSTRKKSALLLTPVYAFFYLIFAGIIFYSFGYLVLVISVVGMSLWASLAASDNYLDILNLRKSKKHMPAVIRFINIFFNIYIF